MRHPFWGRNGETYGEDPYLTGELAAAFVRGLAGYRRPRGYYMLKQSQSSLDSHAPQDSIMDGMTVGDGINEARRGISEQVLLASATCKHFAIHNGPEDYPVSRLSFQANVTLTDVWLTYLPAFYKCLSAGAAGGMCAYSGINGTPDCVNKWLLKDVLRKQWDFQGESKGLSLK
ncbi:unnamed protein product [Protopolystoma xenopodis]|uniref:Glycoside hydrolase family 3 N-terminal domain-containing protein n=1 Tax=Protopolystoma xenopodis TaxID=117903 RepID=A0A3S5CPX0_9PLAT|nr:unnamed protein product [Protopolystoma xenopodis]